MNIQITHRPGLDLMPAGFAEGLDDWSFGDGTPASGSYVDAANAGLADDDDFGLCLELRTAHPMQRLRYMGEVPVRAGHFIEISSRLKVVAGPLPLVRVSTYPGGRPGQRLDLPDTGPVVGLAAHGTVFEVSAIIGPDARPGVHLPWDPRARYAHVGIDLLSETGTTVRIDRISVRDVTRRFLPLGPVLPGFQDL
ncbi:MAG: hypothetical protein QM699_04735 [Amaricoccus sp.]|uniref:hypothetical protein n=1 Tax=Amaricoccus sp. TaxID=1872485 RepID=UPI0039E54F1F